MLKFKKIYSVIISILFILIVSCGDKDTISVNNEPEEIKKFEYFFDLQNKTKKLNDFKKFKVTQKVMSYAKKDAIFLHCLPRGSEVSDEVFLGKQSRVWQQALNRVHVQKSILLWCLKSI